MCMCVCVSVSERGQVCEIEWLDNEALLSV